MKFFILLSLIAFFAITTVSAVVFRNARAQNTLRFVRNVAWAYVAAIVILAAFRVYQKGF